MEDSLSKICEICHQPYKPDVRIGDRQRVCKKIKCQQARKHRAQQAWLKKNPDYFKGRYPQLKEQIIARQRKLNHNKTKAFGNALKTTTTIQDELTMFNHNVLAILLRTTPIQDEITTKFIIINRQLQQLVAMLYKTSEALVFNQVNGF